MAGILGITHTGEYEDIKALCEELDKLKEEKGLDIHVHVDAGRRQLLFTDQALSFD